MCSARSQTAEIVKVVDDGTWCLAFEMPSPFPYRNSVGSGDENHAISHPPIMQGTRMLAPSQCHRGGCFTTARAHRSVLQLHGISDARGHNKPMRSFGSSLASLGSLESRGCGACLFQPCNVLFATSREGRQFLKRVRAFTLAPGESDQSVVRVETACHPLDALVLR